MMSPAAELIVQPAGRLATTPKVGKPTEFRNSEEANALESKGQPKVLQPATALTSRDSVSEMVSPARTGQESVGALPDRMPPEKAPLPVNVLFASVAEPKDTPPKPPKDDPMP